jgi:hypothetical protein
MGEINMKRKSIPLIIIVIIIVSLLFGTAATCNMCGINYTTDTTASATSKNTASDTSSETTGKETAAETIDKETTTLSTEKETAEETAETQITGSSPVIKVIKVTDTGSGVVYDALSTDVPNEWMNQLPVSLELFFHLEITDPDNEKLYCSLSDSNGNNYEPIPVNGEGYADFYWTTPAEPGGLTMKFVITDESGMETIKELSFTFMEY